MHPRATTAAVLSACVVLAGCATQVADAPAVHISEVVKPSPVRALDRVLPTSDELATMLGAVGLMGPLVSGGADMLLHSVGAAEATPADCVSTAYRLQKVVYDAGSARTVASRSWAGGDANGPSSTGSFGVVQFANPDDAQEFFAAAADKWHRCNGQTLVLRRPDAHTDGASRITDVDIDRRTVSAVVMHEAGSTVQRALGVASDCVVDVEISDTAGMGPTGAQDAVSVANLMLQKIGIS
ncbi:hypothetical protein AAV95_19540 [Mycolicibacterium elephantis]|uniref:sensor domain-containing protein n=1 Tax=Mycolicibacterium elephantis TaxID=81858 RepID=UPI00062978F1|nr:sensor domain-containing protein [Mycolicibacterium elephantis]KKW62981.1 hypothetical protein AAV95_19540 [Mycolicibacterium elephantis]